MDLPRNRTSPPTWIGSIAALQTSWLLGPTKQQSDTTPRRCQAENGAERLSTERDELCVAGEPRQSADLEVGAAGTPETDRGVAEALGGYDETVVRGPREAGKLEGLEDREPGHVRELAGTRVQDPYVADLSAGHVVRGVAEVECDQRPVGLGDHRVAGLGVQGRWATAGGCGRR